MLSSLLDVNVSCVYVFPVDADDAQSTFLQAGDRATSDCRHTGRGTEDVLFITTTNAVEPVDSSAVCSHLESLVPISCLYVFLSPSIPSSTRSGSAGDCTHTGLVSECVFRTPVALLVNDVSTYHALGCLGRPSFLCLLTSLHHSTDTIRNQNLPKCPASDTVL